MITIGTPAMKTTWMQVQVMIFKPRPPFLPFSNLAYILHVNWQKMKNDDIFHFIVENSLLKDFPLKFPLCRFFHFFTIFIVK